MGKRKRAAIPSLILFNAHLIIFFLAYFPCLAENIYYKDGRMVEAEIINRTADTIWIEYAGGSIGIDAETISRITNNDGSLSKYGVDYLVDQIHELIKEKKYIEAEKSCSFLLASSPRDVNIRYLRGMLNQKIGNTLKAIEDYNFLINSDNADDAIFNNLGTIEVWLNKYDDATDLFYEAIKRNAQRVEFHNNLSELLMGLEKYDQAIEEYDKVLKLEPDNLVALFNLGVIYKNKGQYSLAGKQWQRVLAIKPDDADARKALLSLRGKR
jgi:tetratricopeptide (TPR) repeat protein